MIRCRASLEEEFHDARISAQGGQHQGRVTDRVAGVDLHPVLEQRLHHPGLIFPGRDDEQGVAVRVGDVGVQATAHLLGDLGDVAQLGRYYPLTGFDISLPLEAMEAYLSAVEQRLKADWEQTRLIIFGHLGDGNLHLAVSLRADSSEERQRVEEIVYSELASRNGSISAEHGIGLQKKAYLHHCRSADEVALMRCIKQALDPRGTLNPGKIFD